VWQAEEAWASGGGLSSQERNLQKAKMGKLLDFGFENIDLWRSEEMELVSLMIPAESAHDTVWALGEIGLLQFIDLNEDKSAFQRTFASQVR
jgi:V-type H+-transporting ATPase subunit a